MRRILLATAIACVLVACGKEVTEPNLDSAKHVQNLEAEVQELKVRVAELISERELARKIINPRSEPGLWDIEYSDKTKEDRPVLVQRMQGNEATPKKLEAAINKKYPRPESPGIEVLRVEDSVAFVKVVDGEMLTQRLGTTGAEHYSAMVTFSLTSLDNVSLVCLVGFDEGDHMAPGCYKRVDFLPLFGVFLEQEQKASN